MSLLNRCSSSLCVFVAALVVTACAVSRAPTPEPLRSSLETERELGKSAQFFVGLDERVAKARVEDAESARVPGFPYLRVNRFLASDVKPRPEAANFDAWVAQLQALDGEARANEIANLPSRGAQEDKDPMPDRASLTQGVRHHGDILRSADMQMLSRRRELANAAHVPPAYSALKRTLGLYPISSVFVLAGVERFHRATHREFQLPPENLPQSGTLTHFSPPESNKPMAPHEVAAIVAPLSASPLGLPALPPRQRERLFATFAPVLEVDLVDDNDRIGTPYWDEEPLPGVDVTRPSVFRRISYARFGGNTLLQLNYVLWFPARLRTGPLDILGGRIDGITWRVTLGRDGWPLIFDTMHNCGCYHMFFPTEQLSLKAPSKRYEEPPLVPQTLTAKSGGRLMIRIAHRTHYIQRISPLRQRLDGTEYVLRDYSELRSLPLPSGGRRSLFGRDGLVAATERRERWLLWPMGVTEPGAMRQWGHHATAFVGRRHFDDPQVIERYFELTLTNQN